MIGLPAGSDRFAGAAALSACGARTVARAWSGRWPPRRPPLRPPGLAGGPRSPRTPRPATGTCWARPGRVQAWGGLPGTGTDDAAAARLAAILGTDLPVLVDADGLTILSQHEDLLPRQAPTLITPHAGELGRLLRTDPARIEAARLEHARQAAEQLGVTVLLKGSTTVVASPGRPTVLVNPTGTPWLATAGSGDVLSGLAGALLAQGLEPAWAGAAAAYLHGLSARLAAAPRAGRRRDREPAPEAPISASDVVRSLPAAFRSLGA